MRCAVLATIIPLLAGCYDFSVSPGSLRCDPALSSPCPEDWLCLLEATADRKGRCYPPDEPLEPDGRLVGPRVAPAVTVPGRRFFVDPTSGSPDNPGTEQAPWRTLAEVVAAGEIERRAADGTLAAAGVVHAGDALVLGEGDHGTVDLSGYFNAQVIYVLAAQGAHPRLSGLSLRSGSNWWFQGLSIQRSGCSFGQGIVTLGESGATEPASLITLVGNTLRSAADVSAWTVDDWKSRACTGVYTNSVRDVRVAFNELRHVADGIRINGKRVTVERNLVDGFREKGMPITGTATRGVKILGNLVTNAYNVNNSQTLIHGSSCDGCGDFEIRKNRLLAHRDLEIPTTFQKPVQGIGLYDGPYDRVNIVNNLVIGQHWHGITVLNGTDVEIVNNTTVLGASPGFPGGPTKSWIQVTGALATVTVRNNLTNQVDVGNGATVDHNGVVSDPAAYFVDWSAGEYRLKKGSPAVDSGTASDAPADDLFGRRRGDPPDLGALER